MVFTYSASKYYDPPSSVYAEGLAALLINSAGPIYTEVAGELNIALPALSSTQIFSGRVNKDDPKLLTIEHEFNAVPESAYTGKTLSLNVVIRSGAEGSPALQSSRSAGYIAVVERLLYALQPYGNLRYLIDAWPAQLSGETNGDYANRKAIYQKQVTIELLSIGGLPSNDAARALSSYEGGCRIQLQIGSSAR